MIVGLVVTALAKIHLNVDDQSLTGLVTFAISTGYYSLVRLAEHHLDAKWGWLLGAKGAPVYTPRPPRDARDAR